MKAIAFVAVALLFAAAASAVSDDELYGKYAEWAKLHSRAAHAAEHVARFENFKSNWHLVRHLNRQGRGRFALNEFADLSSEEFAQRFLRPMSVPSGLETLPYDPLKDYPKAKDWRDEGAVNAVKNQGSCGSCWAFSAVANMEGVYFVSKGELPSLSEQQLVDCDKECMQYMGQKVCDAGCNGGLMPNAFAYAIKNGMESEGDYKYDARTETCKYDASKAKYHFTSWFKVEENEDAMVAALNDQGPLSVAVDASSWSFYSGGIFDSSCGTSLNHGVAIVGYGSDNGKDYWIIRNSWGSSWGLSGYIKLIRGKNKCGVDNFACTIVV